MDIWGLSVEHIYNNIFNNIPNIHYNYNDYVSHTYLLIIVALLFTIVLLIIVRLFCRSNKKKLRATTFNKSFIYYPSYKFTIKSVMVLLFSLSYPFEYIRLYNVAIAEQATIIAKVFITYIICYITFIFTFIRYK